MSSSDFSSFLYLYGAMSQPEINHIVRGQCVQEDIDNLPIIIQNWRNITSIFRNIEQTESEMADNKRPENMKSHEKLDAISQEPLFKNTFSNYPVEFKMVEIDDLIATQRNVSLSYIDKITEKIPDNPSIENLIDICLSTKQDVPIPKSLQQTQNGLTFSSPSVDFRFLGGYLKSKLTDDDLQHTIVGGLPVIAITLFVGYGADQFC